jgi:cyclophilin family peptidyl-prolyl cis-trans isomerase
MVALLLAILLVACGESPTNTPGATTAAGTGTPQFAITPLAGQTTAASGTTASSGTTAASGATTAANGATTAATATTQAAAGATPGAATTTAAASGSGSGQPVSASGNVCLDPTAASAQPAISPTPASTALATLPNLSYTGAREVKLTEQTSKGVLGNINGGGEDPIIGKFRADTVTFSLTADTYDKVETFFRSTFSSAGWQTLRSESDANTKQAFGVFQKDGSKVVINVTAVDDINSYPQEFKDTFKQGDSLVLVASGRAVAATEPTPFTIPGSPVAALQPGQVKLATIEMEKGGKIVIQLCPEIAPLTVENFEKLTTKGFYNNLTFHRVEKNPTPFVVQGGDPQGNGQGGPGYTIPDEFTTKKLHKRGTVAMAHSSAPNSAGSQFYICLGDAPFLDGKYAIFGQVIEGMDVVDKIAVGDKMKSVTISIK